MTYQPASTGRLFAANRLPAGLSVLASSYLVEVQFGARNPAGVHPRLNIDAGKRYVWVEVPHANPDGSLRSHFEMDTEAQLMATQMVDAGGSPTFYPRNTEDIQPNPITYTGEMPTKTTIIKMVAGRVHGGPSSGTVPFAKFPVVRPNSFGPRDVTLFRPAEKDLRELNPADRKAAEAAIDLLRQGKVRVEAKERAPLIGAYTVRATGSLRVAFYLSTDEDWHVFWIGNHNYVEAERRFWDNPGFVKNVHPSEHPGERRRTAGSGLRIQPAPSTQQDWTTVWAFVGDQQVGHLSWDSATGQIQQVFIRPQDQRKGYATEMLAQAREVEPRIHHHTELTDAGRAWSQHVGGARGDLPPAMTYEHVRHPDFHDLIAYSDGWQVGEIQWSTGADGTPPGYIGNIQVKEDYRRRGVASWLLARAREIDPTVHHSESMSPDGKAWSQHVGSTVTDAPATGAEARQFPGSRILSLPGGSLWYSKGIAEDPGGAVIHAVFVEVAARRQGVGTALLDALADRFAHHAVDPGGLTADGAPLWHGWVAANGWVEVNGLAWMDTEDGFDVEASLTTRTAAWRPDAGMFKRGRDTLDPRVFDLATEQMRPEIRASVLRALDAFLSPRVGPEWTQWAKPFLAGSAASYWWDSDGDLDILIGVDLEHLRQVRPANREVSDEEIVAHLNHLLKSQFDPAYATSYFVLHSAPSSGTPSWLSRTAVAPSAESPATPTTSASTTTTPAAPARTPVAVASEGFSAVGATTRSDTSETSTSPVLPVISQTLPALAPGESVWGPVAFTAFVNPGSFDIRAIQPYAAYDMSGDVWVVHPPVLDVSWSAASIPDSTWRRVDEVIGEAEAVLTLPEPARTAAGIALFDWVHEGRRVAYTPGGGGWLDPGNVIYQALSQHPDRLLRRLYLCKHPEAEAAAPPKTAAADWQMAHQPTEDGAPLHDLTETGHYPTDVYTHPQYYAHGEPGFTEAWRTISAARGKPSASVTIYRSMPAQYAREPLGPGTWVGLSLDYTKGHGTQEQEADDWPVMKYTVLADQVRTPGDSFQEWGYYGPPVHGTVAFAGGKNQRVSKVAMPVGPPPPGIRYLLASNSRGMRNPTSTYCILGAVLDGKVIGYLTWGIQGRKVQSIWVDPAQRRRRIAETMFALAKSVDPAITHHVDRTDAGDAWARSLHPDAPVRENNTTGEQYSDEGPSWVLTERLLDPRTPDDVWDLTPGARQVAAANWMNAFSGSGEKHYAYNAPYVSVGIDGPLGPPMELQDSKVAVPWQGDLHRCIEQAVAKAKAVLATDDFWSNFVARKDPEVYLITGSGEKTMVVGTAKAKSLGAHWGPPRKAEYREPWPDFMALLARDPKAAWVEFCKTIADAQPPGFDSHPGLAGQAEHQVTIYRGMTLMEGQHPSTTTNADRGGSGMGSSWTLDLNAAKAIAERGGAGFGADNASTGKRVRLRAGRTTQPTVPAVIRAEVDLNAPGIALFTDGRMYYASEQEVNVDPGTSIKVTGYAVASPVPESVAAKTKAEQAAAAGSYDDDIYYWATYRWGPFSGGGRRTAAASLIGDLSGLDAATVTEVERQVGLLPAADVGALAGYGIKIVAVDAARSTEGSQDYGAVYDFRAKQVHLSRSRTDVNSLRGAGQSLVVLHELGHGMDYAKGRPSQWSLFDAIRREAKATRSYYKGKGRGAEEMFAEAYAATHGGYAPNGFTLTESLREIGQQAHTIPHTGARTAGINGALPDGLRFESEGLLHEGQIYDELNVVGAYVGAERVGELGWYTLDGEISMVKVEPKWRRRGIASALWTYARSVDPKVHHSNVLSADGTQWSRTVARMHRDAGFEGDTPDLRFETKHGTRDGKPTSRLWMRAYADGHEVGLLGWESTTGEVVSVDVYRGWRRRGIATAMWDEAKRIEPRLHHSDSLTDDGRAWSRTTAGARGETPPLTFREEPGRGPYERIITALVDGHPVGSLAWLIADHDGLSTGMISSVLVYDEWQRMGIATALLKKAREIDPRVRHSSRVTDDGAEWAIKVGWLKVGANVRVEVVRSTQANLKGLVKQMDDQGLDELHPLRGVIRRGYQGHLAVAWVGDKIAGGIEFSEDRSSNAVSITEVRTLKEFEGTGVGQAMLGAIAAHALTLPRGDRYEIKVYGCVPSARTWYRTMGADFVPWSTIAHFGPEAVAMLARGQRPPMGKDEDPYPHHYESTRTKTSSRADDLHGKGMAALFPDGAVSAGIPLAPYYGRVQIDQHALAQAISDPGEHLAHFDPRQIKVGGAQASVTRAGVDYYMGEQYARTGQTFADRDQRGNRYPVVYVRANGDPVLVSGRHRAVAALLKGEPLLALRVEAPGEDARRDAHAVRGFVAASAVRAGGQPGRGGGGDHLGADRGGVLVRAGAGDAARAGSEPGDGRRPRALRQDRLGAARALRLYHGTLAKNVESIRANGLTPPAGVNPAGWFMLTTSREQAARYAPYEDPVVIEFSVPRSMIYDDPEHERGTDFVLWPGAEHDVYDQRATAYAVNQTLPARFLVAVHPVPHTAAGPGHGVPGYQASLESGTLGAVEETRLKTYPKPVQDLVHEIQASPAGREMAGRVFRFLAGPSAAPVSVLSDLDLAQYLHGKDWTWADVLKRET